MCSVICKERPLSLPEPTKAAQAAWIGARGTEPGTLFLDFYRTSKGERLTGPGLYLVVRDLGKKAGPHCPPKLVSAFLGADLAFALVLQLNVPNRHHSRLTRRANRLMFRFLF